jgi:hypothetical protein
MSHKITNFNVYSNGSVTLKFSNWFKDSQKSCYFFNKDYKNSFYWLNNKTSTNNANTFKESNLYRKKFTNKF